MLQKKAKLISILNNTQKRAIVLIYFNPCSSSVKKNEVKQIMIA